MRTTRALRWLLPIAVATAMIPAGPACAADQSPARYIARDGLLVYAEFSGLDAHAVAWRRTSTYRMLHETTAGAMLEDVFTQMFDSALATAPPGPKPTGQGLVAAFERLARSGFAIGITGEIKPPDSGKIDFAMPYQAVIAIRDAGGPESAKGARPMLDLLTKAAGKSERVTREDGRKVTYIKPPEGDGRPWAWWFEGNDLIVSYPGSEASVEKVVETLSGKRPSAVDSPIRVELAKKVGEFEPVFVSYAELSKLPPLPPSLGLAGMNRIDSRWGFTGNQLMSSTRIIAPSPRKGVLALMDQQTFIDKNNLPVPRGLNEFTVVSVDPGKLFDQVVAIARETDPNADAVVKQFLGLAQGALGVPLRDELLAQLGPRMAFYLEPELKPIPITPYQSFIDWGLHPPKVTTVIEVRDSARFAKTLDVLADVANRRLKAARAEAPEGADIQLRPLKGAEKGYVLDVPLGAFPLPSGVRPTLMLGKGYLAIAISPAAARKALAFEGMTARSDHEASAPRRLVALNVNDPRSYVPDLIANVPFLVQAFSMVGANGPRGPVATGALRLKIDLDGLPTADVLATYMSPGTIEVSVDDRGIEIVTRDSVPSINPISAGPMAVALLVPAVNAARDAAKRSQSVNNLKQIMLGMHNYLSANDVFPPAAISDAEGKPLLSWRVAILPFVEGGELYKEFHLDEPWDSEHNKKLIPRMPAIYKSPKNQPSEPNSTYYQVFTGNGSLFDPKGKGARIADVLDGTSNTLAAFEAGTAVVWTKPDDVPFDPQKDLPKFGGPGFPGGFNAGLADGSVRFIKNSVNATVLKALITRAGGEVISGDSF